MRGLREPLVSRGFRCGPEKLRDGSFAVTMPPDFPCYYDIVGKEYAARDYVFGLATLRKYLDGALALAGYPTADASSYRAQFEPGRPVAALVPASWEPEPRATTWALQRARAPRGEPLLQWSLLTPPRCARMRAPATPTGRDALPPRTL